MVRIHPRPPKKISSRSGWRFFLAARMPAQLLLRRDLSRLRETGRFGGSVKKTPRWGVFSDRPSINPQSLDLTRPSEVSRVPDGALSSAKESRRQAQKRCQAQKTSRQARKSAAAAEHCPHRKNLPPAGSISPLPHFPSPCYNKEKNERRYPHETPVRHLRQKPARPLHL